MPATDPITPQPRWFSFRLPRPLWLGVATALMVVAAAALKMGIPVYLSHVAIRDIEKIGGRVDTRHFRPAWIRRRIPDEFAVAVEDVIAVSLNGTELTDGDMVQLQASLGRFRNAEALDLSNTGVTDVGLRNIEVLLPRLRKLHLHGTIVSNSRIADATRKLPGLEVYTYRGVFK